MSGRTKRQITGKLTIKRGGDQKYLIFSLQKRAHTGWERRREKGRKEKKKKKRKEEEEEEEEEAKKGIDSSMELYGTMVLYGIMCNLDFGRDFYGFQT